MENESKTLFVESVKAGKHGVYFGYGYVNDVLDGDSGELVPYFDRQGDHIPYDVGFASAVKYMEGDRVAKAMHKGEEIGRVVFGLPINKDIAKSVTGITGDVAKTGFYIGMLPNPEYRHKFDSGELSSFSLGGLISRSALKRDGGGHDRSGGFERVSISKEFSEEDSSKQLYIVDSMELNEFSGVDVPAMEPAVIEVVKGMNDQFAEFIKKNQDSLNNSDSKNNLEIINMAEKQDNVEKEQEKVDVDAIRVDSALNSLSPEQKEFYDSADDSAKADFLGKDYAGRQEMVDSAKSSRNVVYKADDGTEYFEDSNENEIKMAKRVDELERDAAKARERIEYEDCSREVATKYANLKGTVDAKVSLMRKIRELPEDSRKSVEEMLESADNALKMISTPRGYAVSESTAMKSADEMTKGEANAYIMAEATKRAKENDTRVNDEIRKIGTERPDIYAKAKSINGGTR